MADTTILGPAAERRLRWVLVPQDFLLVMANLGLRGPKQDSIALPVPHADLPDDVEAVDCRYVMKYAAHALLCASKHWDRIPFGQEVPTWSPASSEMRSVRIKINQETPSAKSNRAV